MNQLRHPIPTRRNLTWTALIATVACLAWAGPASGSDDDPFADNPPAAAPEAVPSKAKVPPAPAAAPAASAATISPGIVEQLPASAYPEPYTRGLYGGPLWLDMQGLQWPYMPHSGVGISGYGWIDGNYRLIRSGNPSIPPTYHELLDQGRFVLRITPTYTEGSWFVQAQAEIVANTDQQDVQPAPTVVGADDVWVRTGTLQSWDVTVGRFQAFDVYPLGMGLDLNTYERLGAFDPVNNTPGNIGTVAALYAADYLLYRPSGAKVADAALHVYPFQFLRVEALAQFGNNGLQNVLGGRPAVIFDVGWLKLRGALEYLYKWERDPDPTQTNTERDRGGAGSAQVVFAPYVEAGLNFGYAVYDLVTASNPTGDPGNSGNRISYGGFIDASPIPAILPNLLLGLGANYAVQHNLLKDQDMNYEQSTNMQLFAAVQYLFYKQLYLKVVGGYAKSHFQNQHTSIPYDDDMFSLRVRMQYLF